MMQHVLLAMLCAALAGSASGNVGEANLGRAHRLHADHRQQQAGDMSMLLNSNPEDAPLVTGKTINLAREMAMAEAADDVAALHAKAAKKEAEHAAIRQKIVTDMTAPFKEYGPLTFLTTGFGAVILITLLFWVGERIWLQNTLPSCQSFWDPEITKRMYPLF